MKGDSLRTETFRGRAFAAFYLRPKGLHGLNREAKVPAPMTLTEWSIPLPRSMENSLGASILMDERYRWSSSASRDDMGRILLLG